MARFHVYRLGHSEALVLDLQSDLLTELTTRTMAPLLQPEDLPRTMRQLNPRFLVGGQPYIMATQFIGAVSIHEIGSAVADLTADGDRITAAVDFLFQGF